MSTRHRARFGAATPEEGALTYGSYLRVGELTSLQTLLSDPPAHDELLFITVHQAYELWFKELIFELQSARDAILAGRLTRAQHYLRRAEAVDRLLVAQVDVIETMHFQDFLEFRDLLKPASGFQSMQFREMEAISGLKDPKHLDMAETDEERARFQRRLDEPTLWDAFVELVERSGHPMPADDADVRRASLVALASAPDRDPYLISEALLNHDALISMWRSRHVLMVERQIGAKPGTGGSSGAGYLRTTLDKRFYPDLWGMRSAF